MSPERIEFYPYVTYYTASIIKNKWGPHPIHEELKCDRAKYPGIFIYEKFWYSKFGLAPCILSTQCERGLFCSLGSLVDSRVPRFGKSATMWTMTARMRTEAVLRTASWSSPAVAPVVAPHPMRRTWRHQCYKRTILWRPGTSLRRRAGCTFS